MDHRPLDDEARKRRRIAARRRTRRRRFAAAGSLLVAAAATAIAFVLAGTGHPDGIDDATATTPAAAVRAKPADHRTPEPPSAKSAPPRQPIPILMYHAVEAAPPGSTLPELWVPAETFAATVSLLEDRGYHAISMQDAYDYWRGRRRVPRNPIVFTFDDGFLSQVTNALPALRSAGWAGVLYLEVAALHTPAPDGLSRADVRALLHAGWELGSHTMTHPDLTSLSGAQLDGEIAGARRWIRREFGEPVNTFCYPAGKHDDEVVAAVEAAGYETATTVDPGLAGPDDLLRLPRIRVNASDSPEAVLDRIAGFGAPQS